MELPSLHRSVPRPPILTIDRERLLDKLNQAVQYKLTLIVAPPGYGKTTLASQFAQAMALPVIWHTVEERERDAPSLFAHCLACFAEVIPNDQDILAHPGATPAELATTVADYLKETLTEDVVYVMDNTHHLEGSPGAKIWLRTLIAAMPASCHIILVGRAVPAFPLAEMIAYQSVQVIGQDDLRFTFEEVSELAAKVQKHDLSAPEVYKTFARLNGWPAGTVLALQPLPADIEAFVFEGKSGPEALFDQLAEVMLEAQSPLLRDFLLASSTLAQMTPTACQTILELSHSLEWLTEALQRNLFISQISGGMVYHMLFRDFLQRQLQSRQPERFIQLHTQAGRYFEANNRLDEAFEHYVAAQLWETAGALAERAAPTFLAQSKAETILHWNEQLHQTAILTPRLHYTAAMIHTDRYQYNLATVELAAAAAEFEDSNDTIGLTQVALLQANIHNQQGEPKQALDKAETIVRQSDLPNSLRGYALFILGTAHNQLGDGNSALDYLEAALLVWRHTSSAYALSQLLLTLVHVYTHLGRFNEAATCLEEVVATQRILGNRSSLALALNHLGYHYHLLGEYQQAMLRFQEGLQIVSRIPEKRAESYLLWSIGDLQRDCRADAEAEAAYFRALQLAAGSEPALHCSILLSLATLRRWQNDTDEALSIAHEAIQLAEKHDLAVEKLRGEVCIWAIYAHQGQPEIATSKLDRLVEAFQQRQAQSRWVQALGVRAQIALSLSDQAAASRCLQQAVKSVRHPANLQPLVAEIVHFPLLKAHVLSHPQRFDYLAVEVQKLEQAQVETPDPSNYSRKLDGIPTYSLRVQAFGREHIERDGHPVAFAAWRSAAARELFFYLLFRGPATYEHTGLALWPDDSPIKVRQKLHTTLHRARTAVGAQVILFEDDLYRINPDLDVWCDIYEFEKLVREAKLSSPLTAHAEILWRQAIDLYRGDFLSSFDADWIVAYRENLRQSYLEALIALGNCVRVRGNLQEAIATFKQALQLDPYSENIYRALISCYADMGERNLIQRQLQELTDLLDAELGVAPSLETITLVQTLLN